MKHGLKLTRKEKELLQKEGHDPNSFLRIKRTTEYYEFLNRHTGEILPIERGE